jgi:hypothetical protein
VKREELAPDEEEAIRQANTAGRRVKREELAPEEAEAIRQANTAGRRVKREELKAKREEETPYERALRLIRTGRTVRLFSAACRRRHVDPAGNEWGCASEYAGHWPKYQVSVSSSMIWYIHTLCWS